MGKGLIIGVSGRARSGKNTFAELLAEELFNSTKKRFVLMAYAHELKLRVQKDFDLSYDQLWGDKKEVPDHRYMRSNCVGDCEDNFWTPREIMQAYGEFYRSIDNEFWVKNLFRVILDKEYNNVIITDVRHINEAIPVKEHNGYIIRVNSNRDGMEAIHGSNHISETAMDNYEGTDFTINNDGTIDDLRVAAKQLIKLIIELEVNKNG